jgi:hypothetical protein
MIGHSSQPWKKGDIIIGMYDANMIYHKDTRALILREATEEEYIQNGKLMFSDFDFQETLSIYNGRRIYYYEISTD